MPGIKELERMNKTLHNVAWESDSTRYFEDCLHVQDEHGQIVPFVRNPHQLRVREAMDEQKRKGLPVRIIVLKPRKTGTSTEGVGDMQHAVRFHPADAMLVGNEFKTSEYLFGIIRRFYDNMPESEQVKADEFHRRGLTLASRRKGESQGRIIVETAGKTTVGRGFTPLYLLCSEAAYYENSEQVMNSLLNSVPDTPESMVIVESTANGMSGYFWSMWEAAKSRDSSFIPVFLSWVDFPKYSMRVPEPEMFQATLTKYEKEIRETYKLTLEQLYWRRYTILNKCGRDEEFFKQEYPLNDMEAFLTSGRGRFDRQLLATIQTSDPLCGYIETKEMYGGSTFAFTPNIEGYIRMWKRPQKGHEYVIGADVAQGIEIEGAPREDRYDYSTADVIDSGTGEQVAQIRESVEPKQFGLILSQLGRWYNWAFMGVEVNGHGETVLLELEHQSYPEARTFSRRTSPHGERLATPQKGWLTSSISRNNMIDNMAMVLLERSTVINSRETVRECMTFVRKANGKTEAQEGSKDDLVFSYGIALMMLQHAPMSVKPQDTVTPSEMFKPVKYRHSNSAYNRI